MAQNNLSQLTQDEHTALHLWVGRIKPFLVGRIAMAPPVPAGGTEALRTDGAYLQTARARASGPTWSWKLD